MRLLTLLVLLCPMAASAADWNDSKSRVEAATTTLTKLQEEIRTKGGDSLSKLSQQVVLVVSESGPDEPRSSIASSGRRIAISDLFLAKTVNLARLVRLNRSETDQSCAYAYKAHMERTGSRILPEAYLQSAPPECAQLKGRLPIGSMSEAIAAREVEATLMFAYLHELGHQFHNHQAGGIPFPPNITTKENQCSFLSAMRLRRELEYEADEFAVDSMAKLGISPLIFSITALWLLPPAATDTTKVNFDQLFGERLAEHPNSGFRWARILDRTAAILSRQANLNPQIAQLIAELKDWQRRAQLVVADNDKALSPC